MKKIGFIFYCAFLLSGLRAEDLPVDILILTRMERDRDTLGSTIVNNNAQTFRARFTNRSLDPIKNLEVKLYVVAGDNVPRGYLKKDCAVIKVLEHGGIDLGVPGDTEIDLGEVEFKFSKSTTTSVSGDTKTITSTYRGIVYQGYVAVFSLGGKEIGTKVFGGKEIEEAFKAFIKSK